MHAYQFQQDISASHQITIDLPPDAPTGRAQIIVLFPDAPRVSEPQAPVSMGMAGFAAWLQTQPPTGRSAEEIEQHIRQERESWE